MRQRRKTRPPPPLTLPRPPPSSVLRPSPSALRRAPAPCARFARGVLRRASVLCQGGPAPHPPTLSSKPHTAPDLHPTSRALPPALHPTAPLRMRAVPWSARPAPATRPLKAPRLCAARCPAAERALSAAPRPLHRTRCTEQESAAPAALLRASTAHAQACTARTERRGWATHTGPEAGAAAGRARARRHSPAKVTWCTRLSE